MTLSFDPGDDLAQVADGVAAVTLTRPGSSLATVVAGALGSRVRSREVAESAGRYTASDVAWHLPAGELTEAPQAGDVIVDAADQRWTVLDVEKVSLATRWRCVARNLAVVHGLDAYADVERATVSKGQAGAETIQWHTWKTGLAARIQPTGSKVRTKRDRRVTEATFRIYLGQNVDLDRTHRLRGSDGKTYGVRNIRKADRVDALMEVDAVRTS